MPVVIKELVIKATVDANERPPANAPATAAPPSADIRKQWMEECVRQVLEILKEKNER